VMSITGMVRIPSRRAAEDTDASPLLTVASDLVTSGDRS